MGTLSDLFAVYNSEAYKEYYDEPEIYLPEPEYKWEQFLNNIRRAQNTAWSRPIDENSDQEPFDWNSIEHDNHNQLWGFSPTITTFTVKRGVENPFDNAIVSEARTTDDYYEFKTIFDEYKQNHPNSGLSDKDWDILEGIAGIESTYRNIQNQGGSSAWGYFQFMPDTANHYQEGAYEDMKSDPELQIELAVKHYKYLKNRLRNSSQYLEKSNLTPFQIMYGMWWRPGSVENYLRTGFDDFSDTDKNNLQKILKKAS